jgi:serine/threonine-protein kinase
MHPTRIGKYEVECVIGEGAMGVVYRAVDPVINRRVAIKVMADSVAQDAALRERFLREAQAAGSLQHPNVVTIYDFGEVGDHLYIAMEYVEGNDLADLLRKRVEIPVDQALELVIGLLHGLAYAHKRGIVHRDIKPANIRVDSEGNARLMDFGVAHLASSEMTNTGVLLGTPSYMAPEQITGSPVVPETDIFSVGTVLYELLTQHRPFESDTLQSLMYQILSKTPEPVDTLVPGLPAGLNRVVMRALAKDQNERYRSALAMANDLATIRDALPPRGKRTSLSLRATIDTALADERNIERRKRHMRQLALAVGLLITAGAIFAAVQVRSRSRVAPLPAAAIASAPSVAPPATAAPDTSRPRATPAAATPSAAPPPATPRVREAVPGAAPSRAAGDTRRPADAIGRPASPPRPVQPTVSAGGAPALVSPAPREASREPTTAERPLTVTQQQSSAPTASVMPVSPPAPAPVQEPRENAAEQIAAVVAAYARALESRDIAELRRVYPSMTAEQRRAFEEFFRSTRSLDAALSVSGLQVDGSTAEAQLTGTFNYVTTAGVTERRPVSFRAALRREGSSWTLVAVR